MKRAKKKIFILAIVVVIVAGAVLILNRETITSEQSSDDNNSITYINLNKDYDDIEDIYDLDYQNEINEQISNLIDKNDYTLQNPLLIANPYGTNTTDIYMYFSSDEACKASYTIEADGYSTFSKTLNNNSEDGYTNEHEYLLVGSIPGVKNFITVTLTNQNDEVIDTLSWSYDAPELVGSEDNIQLDVTSGESTQALDDGLYTMLGNRTTEDNEEIDFILIYDNDGTIRSEIPIISYRSCRLLFEDNTMYFSISASKIAAMNQTGQITAIYDTSNYNLHHDYIFGNDNNFLVLASKEDSSTEEDIIISIDKASGEVRELIDLKELFKNYYSNLSNNSDDEPLDWIHINSIELVGDDTIIISSRETSSIIKINNIYDEPEIDYIIGSKQFWQESNYDNLVLNQIGDFSINAGQHCVVYQEDQSLPAGQYYLYFYNNNNTICSTRDYNYSSDNSYYNTGVGSDGETSYYDKYLIDENNRTFSLVERIPVTYFGYVSSVQELGDNVLIDGGGAFEASEYDSNNQLIQTVKGTGATWWYRVFKYDYNDYWFQ